jgi:hypothetical protein
MPQECTATLEMSNLFSTGGNLSLDEMTIFGGE